MLLHLVTYASNDNDEETADAQPGLLMEEGIVSLEALIAGAPVPDLHGDCCFDLLTLLTCPECLDIVRQAAAWYESQSEDARRGMVAPADEVRLLPPIWPNNIFCLAGNFMEHVAESAGKISLMTDEKPPAPRVFMKPVSQTLRADGDPIVLAKTSTFVDWEAEMAVIIGREGRYIKAEDAMEHVAGVTCMLDVSERRLSIWERAEVTPWEGFFDWLNGKWMDSFAPMGPCVVPATDLDLSHLSLKLWVNDKLMQDGSTAQMVFGVPQVVEYLSQILTLEPGDVISLGTPSGVGFPQGIQLKHGDVVRMTLQDVGTLTNPVVAE